MYRPMTRVEIYMYSNLIEQPNGVQTQTYIIVSTISKFVHLLAYQFMKENEKRLEFLILLSYPHLFCLQLCYIICFATFLFYQLQLHDTPTFFYKLGFWNSLVAFHIMF